MPQPTGSEVGRRAPQAHENTRCQQRSRHPVIRDAAQPAADPFWPVPSCPTPQADRPSPCCVVANSRPATYRGLFSTGRPAPNSPGGVAPPQGEVSRQPGSQRSWLARAGPLRCAGSAWCGARGLQSQHRQQPTAVLDIGSMAGHRPGRAGVLHRAVVLLSRLGPRHPCGRRWADVSHQGHPAPSLIRQVALPVVTGNSPS
jgi:hypothetical protein